MRDEHEVAAQAVEALEHFYLAPNLSRAEVLKLVSSLVRALQQMLLLLAERNPKVKEMVRALIAATK